MPSVAIRAFRGTRRSSVYREHVLDGAAFERIAAGWPQEFDKAGARRLAEELTALRASAVMLDLDDDLTAIAELARWCSRATGDAWLRIGPRTGV
jgi:hypothetical protein